MIKACLFDLDGVIVNTSQYHYLAWKRLAEELGFDFKPQDNERLKGISRIKSLELLLETGGMKNKFDDEQKQAMAETKNKWYLEYVNSLTPDDVLPGVIPFLRELRNNRIGIALGSASKNTALILDRLGIQKLFDCIIDGNQAAKAKPDPEIFILAAEKLNVPAAGCVVFEDAEAGIEAAVRAGMKSIGIGNPAILHKASAVINNLEGFTLKKLNALVPL